MKSGFVDKLIDRLDRLDTGSVQAHFLHLAKEKGLMETILQAVQEGILMVSGEGRIIYANQAAETMLGFHLDEAAGQRIGKYVRGIEWERILDLDEKEWSRLLSRELEVTYPEHRFVTFYVVPLGAVSSDEDGAVVILRDITRDREMEAHTIESERLNALTLLAAGVAHEIGNPLNSITIHLQLLERELRELSEEDRKPLTELVEVARKEVARLDQILNQFLKAIRPSRPNFTRASLADVLRETLDFLKHEVRNRDVLVEVDQPDHLPTSLVDKGQIRQAFFNIIRNAIQAMPGGGLLKISLSSDDRFVSVSFKDAGPGIPPDELGAIFEPYHTTRSTGSGLGLMIVQRIIRDHGGEIEVHSEPGAGTTFTLFLPRDQRRIRLLNAHHDKTETTPAQPRKP